MSISIWPTNCSSQAAPAVAFLVVGRSRTMGWPLLGWNSSSSPAISKSSMSILFARSRSTTPSLVIDSSLISKGQSPATSCTANVPILPYINTGKYNHRVQAKAPWFPNLNFSVQAANSAV